MVLALTQSSTDGDLGPLYCDSCHQGRAKITDRSDPKLLGTAMHDVYVTGLSRTDGKPNGCATCHGDPFNPKLLTTWATK
jgi:hypothetical protein